MPSAMLGEGLSSSVSTKVTAGRTMNCAAMPLAMATGMRLEVARHQFGLLVAALPADAACFDHPQHGQVVEARREDVQVETRRHALPVQPGAIDEGVVQLVAGRAQDEVVVARAAVLE